MKDLLQTDLDYRGYIISPVFHYNNGKSDFNVYRPDGESGYMEHMTTLEQVKKDIDEKVEESED